MARGNWQQGRTVGNSSAPLPVVVRKAVPTGRSFGVLSGAASFPLPVVVRRAVPPGRWIAWAVPTLRLGRSHCTALVRGCCFADSAGSTQVPVAAAFVPTGPARASMSHPSPVAHHPYLLYL